MEFVIRQLEDLKILEAVYPSPKEQKSESIYLKLPDGIRCIGDYAFARIYSNLTQIELPNSLRKVQVGAFEGCEKLYSIDIPDSTEYIGKLTFYGCKNLRSVKLSKNLKLLSLNCFNGCSSLDVIEIPQGVEINDMKYEWGNVPKGFRLIANTRTEDGKGIKITIFITDEYKPTNGNLYSLNSFLKKPSIESFRHISGGVVFRYPAVIACLKHFDWAKKYIRNNIFCIGKYLIGTDNALLLEETLNELNFKGRKMIDNLLEYALKAEKREASIILMQYKQKIGGYKNNNDLQSAKRFEL